MVVLVVVKIIVVGERGLNAMIRPPRGPRVIARPWRGHVPHFSESLRLFKTPSTIGKISHTRVSSCHAESRLGSITFSF